MAKKNIVTCRYANCRHEDKKLEKENAVKIGASYYHKDCAKIKTDINLAVELFINKVNKNIIMGQLRKIINDIVFNKDVDSNFLIFAIEYCVNNKRPLNYPAGLYYIVQDKRIVDAYANKVKAEQALALQKAMVQQVEEPMEQFTYTPTKQHNFTDILWK